MKFYNSVLFLIILSLSGVSCNSLNNNEMRCALFLNPSQAFYSNKVHFKAKLNDSLILDTILKNKRIDNSELLKCFYFDKSSRQVLSVDIDGKKRIVDLKFSNKKCVNVFIGIDDYHLLQRKADEIEEIMKHSSSTVNYRKLLDSLRMNSNKNQYDSISVNIKVGRCLCRD